MLAIENVSRLHGNQNALNNVSVRVAAGEVVGFVDREGLGILELANILSGLHWPDSGQILIDGKRLQWPFRPQKYGIGIIYREPEIVESLDIASNIFLGSEEENHRWFRFFRRKTHQETTDLIARLNLNLPTPHTLAINLTKEQRQLVAIAQLVIQSPRIILIDNPSQTLSLPYQEQLLDLIRTWQQEDRAIVFNSSNLDYLFAVCDRIVVLREGKVVIDVQTDKTNREEIVAALIGFGDRRQITPVIWALDSYYQALRQAELLRHNKLLLEQDLARQDTINQGLLEQLSIQVEALDKANLALQNAQRRLLTEREQERKYLARELHDQTIQELLTVNYQLEEILDTAEVKQPLKTSIDTLRYNIRGMVDDLRQVCGKLRPPTIDSFGLGAALQSFTSTWSERTGIEVILEIDDAFGRLPEEIELSLFRIVQEGLSNVRKHAQASQVHVKLRHASPRMLHLSIADNGEGLDQKFDLSVLSRTGHYGILGITERVALMGGRINFRNQPDSGLLIQVEIPHPRMKQTEIMSELSLSADAQRQQT
jgi:signal transduction histidine kinase